MTEEEKVMTIDALDVAIGLGGFIVGLILGTLVSGWMS